VENFSVDNKLILVVGASRGIGFEIAKSLEKNSAKVIGIARSDINPSFEYQKTDLTKNESIVSFLESIENKNLKFDGIVINAAISEPPRSSSESKSNIFTQDPIKFRDINNNNLVSIYNFLFKIGKFISKNASLVFISSIGSVQGFPGNPAYQTSKAGINALVRALAIDLSPHNIRVNYLNLGYINAPMSKISYEDKTLREARSSRTILNRWGEINEVIGPIIFLLSDDSSYITGSGINVDGGWLAKGL